MRLDTLRLPPSADFHIMRVAWPFFLASASQPASCYFSWWLSLGVQVHLRDGAMMELVTPTIKDGGVDTVYVMPNLTPPITTVEQALRYKARLQPLAPDVTFLMTLYLHPSITPDTIAEASKAGIAGVKCYPAGVTTNSDAGVVDLDGFYPVFKAMEQHDMVLNLHGEVPSTAPSAYIGNGSTENITILNAEAKFLPTLHKLHAAFPHLRIVLEHCTSKDALEAVAKCGPNVVGTITAHHLWLTVDDVCGDAFCFCKPVAKTPADRLALIEAATGKRNPGKFFFGSDSAPHPVESKTGPNKAAAGCFTQAWSTQLVVAALQEAVIQGWVAEEDITQEILEGFLGLYGREFYRLGPNHQRQTGGILVESKQDKIPDILQNKDATVKVVPFRRGESIASLKWNSEN